MNNRFGNQWRVASVAVVIAMLLTIVLAPSAVMAAPNAAATASSNQTHVVRAGETLSGIAMMYGVPMYALMQANMISDPNKVYVGQRLAIPGGDMGMGGMGDMGMGDMGMGGMGGMNMGGMNDMDMGQGMCRTYHTVGWDETGADVARMYGVSTYSLAQANGLDDVSAARPGQKLCIPKNSHPVNEPAMPKPEMPKPMPMPEPMPMPKPMPMPPVNGCTMHVVMRGDTLSKIAMQYGVNMMQIMKLNGIMDPNHIEVGQRLKIECDMDMGKPMPMPMPEPMPMPMPEHRPMPMPENRPMPMPEPMPQHRPMPEPMPMPMPEHRPMPMPENRPMPEPMPMPEHKPMKPMMEVEQGPWRGYYYCDKYFGGEPVIVREDYDIRFNWYGESPGEMIPNDNFSVKWERTAKLSGGYYRWVAVADDGIRIYVDDKLVLDGWREQPATEYTAEFFAEPGYHKFRVEYYEEGNEASINVRLEAVWK